MFCKVKVQNKTVNSRTINRLGIDNPIMNNCLANDKIETLNTV